MVTIEARRQRILKQLRDKYPGSAAYDLDGNGKHYVCEVDPVSKHAEYDRAVEVIISSKPHKHLKMTQWYTILSGNLKFHSGEEEILLKPGDKHTVMPGTIHWAESVGGTECWLELYSEPGWTKEDHILLDSVTE